TETLVASRKVGQAEAPVATAKETSGGRIDSEVSEVAVNPAGPEPASAQTTVTPAGWERKSDRNSSSVTTVVRSVEAVAASVVSTDVLMPRPQLSCDRRRARR